MSETSWMKRGAYYAFPKNSMDEWDSPNHKHVDATYLLLYRREKTGWSNMRGSKGKYIMVGNLTINIVLGCYIMVETIITFNTQLLEIIANS